MVKFSNYNEIEINFIFNENLSFNNKLKVKNTYNSREIAVFYIINLIEKPLIGCQFPKTVKFESFTPVAHKGIKRKNKEKIDKIRKQTSHPSKIESPNLYSYLHS